MALKVDASKAYERTLVDPENGTEYGVRYRKLRHADIERRRKEATKIKGKGRKATVDYDKETADYWTVKRAIIDWDVPFEPVREELEDTEDWLLQQVFRHIAEINPSLAAELRAFDSDEDDETDTPDEQENKAAIKANGHNDPDQAQVFAEDEGPTTHAATS